jgi:DNA-binding SARP family transcriptional activator
VLSAAVMDRHNVTMADRLGVRLLGPFRLDGVDLDALRSRQSRTVLKRLALARGTTVSAETLVEVVWPEVRPSLPERDVHALVSRARAVVGAERLVRRDGGYALLADWWDVAELESLVREAVRRDDEGDHAGARTAAEAALALVRDTLLSDEADADWAAASRAAAGSLVAQARRVAGTAALATGQVGSAAAHATEALRHDPFDEHALRTLMRAQASAGRPASALAEFARFRELLAEELGVDPSPETRALHEELLRAEPRPASVTAGPRLVGRARQLAVLDRELDRTADQARVVLLTGEPGSGKTTLLDAWTTSASAAGTVVLRGRAEEGELALQPVLDALARSLTEVTHLGVGGPAPGTPALPGPGATTDALNLRVFGHLDDAVGSLAGRGRLALLLDNGDDADPVTWSWLAHLGRRREPHVLVVVALRDRANATLASDLVLDVPPLGLAEATELVGPERAERLWERSGGNALLLTELARADGTEDVPGSLREAVSGRLRRTGAAAVTLQTAAILGAGIDLDLLAAVADVPPLDVLGHLDTGVRQAFLTDQGGTLAFRHELVRLAVAAEAGTARRAWVHRRAAEVLCERPDAHPLDVARHARECGDRALAARGLADASDLALARLDLPGTERLLDDAIALEDSAPLRLRRSRVRMSRGDLDGADADAEHAMATDDTGEALELRAWAARNRHDLDGAVRLGRAAAAVASDPTIRASSLIAVAFGHRGNGDLRQADAVLAEAHDAPAELGLPAWTGVLRVHQGRPTEALTTLEPTLGAEARRGTQGFWVEHTVQMTAHAYGLLGRTADALRILDRLEREIERRGTSVRYAGVQHTYRSWLLRNLGDPDAEELALRGLEVAGSQEILAQCHLDVADSLLRMGDLGAAAHRLDVAHTESGTRRFHNKWRFDQRRCLILARLGLAEHDASAALEAVDPVAAAAEERGDVRYAVLGRLVRATALARLGESVDLAQVSADLAALDEVAVLEGWWLAADVGDATGLPLAAATAHRLAGLVAREAGPREAAFREVAGRRLG